MKSSTPDFAAAQQPVPEALAIETAAARAALLYMPKTADGLVKRGLNPLLVGESANAELGIGRRRDSLANAQIAREVFLVPHASARVCSALGCELGDFAGYLSMSEPRLDSGYAVITVNVLTPNPRPRAVYSESYRFGLRKDVGGEWKLCWVDDLRPSESQLSVPRPTRMWAMPCPVGEVGPSKSPKP